MTAKLNWMLIGKEYTEADGARFPGTNNELAWAANVGDDDESYQIWPSMPPEHLADKRTLSLRSGEGLELGELGRFETDDEAKAAAELHYAEYFPGSPAD